MALTPLRRFSSRCVQPVQNIKDALEMAIILPASVSYPMGTILGEETGTNEVVTLTVDATSGNYTLTFGGQTTANIAYNATAAAVQAALVAISTLSSNAIQTLTLNGTPTGGYFQIAFRGKMSNQIAYDAAAATVQTELENICGTGNVTVTGSAGGPYTITFGGLLAGLPIPALEAWDKNLVPTTATATFAVVVLGGGGGEGVAVTGNAGGPYTITFQGAFGDTNVGAITADSTGLAGNTHTASLSVGTAGVAGVQRKMKAWTSTATDGSQVAKAVLKYDCETDSSGNITMGQLNTGGEHGETWDHTFAWFRGDFDTNDLVNATPTNIDQLGKIIQGSLAAGGILRIT